jgi:transposase-like protein
MTGRKDTYAVERIPPSERVRKEIDELLNGKTPTKSQDETEQSLLLLAMKRILQEVVEQEQADFLGRERYKHQAEGRGWRNGYEPKTLRTAVGKVPLEVPQTRGTEQPFHSKLLEGLSGRTGVLERLVTEMYARGLSARDIEAVFVSATGEPLVSRSVVSEVTESLTQEFEAFQQHDLTCYDLECLYLDAIYEALRLRAGVKEAVLCAWGVLRDGRKILLYMTLGNKESYDAWLEMLRNMVSRGLKVPLSVTADGAPGLNKAIDQAYPKSLRIRCWVHKMRNIRAKLPRDVVPEVEAEIYTIRDAATFEQGQARMQEVVAKYRGLYPSAMACLGDDAEASLNHLKLPARLRQLVRSTNLLERTFEEGRRRTKVIPRFFAEKPCLKLVFAALIRACENWARVKFSETELEQLDTLRRTLGLAVDRKTEPGPQTLSQKMSA